MNGIPVIFVVADMVDFSYLPTEWKGKYYEVVYNATELERAINTLMENNDAISVDSESFIVNPNKDNVGMMMS